ncbi:hypothetical protein [Motiliproteus sediminis]|uniref:hypothetical protein n=1 Tax=Motiliproteus sediminis TaxID=1468178 RepID=UPI001AF006F0|nr:hypothetical protein [Motiliproteus sediminis]
MNATAARDQGAEPSPRFNLVFGLLSRCPCVEQADCVLAHQRKLPLRMRYEWARSLSEEQLERIYQHHHRCLARQRAVQRRPVQLIRPLG